MPALPNARHENFAQVIAKGKVDIVFPRYALPTVRGHGFSERAGRVAAVMVDWMPEGRETGQ